MQQRTQTSIIKAFVNAFRGLMCFFRHERNGRIQMMIGTIAIILGLLLRLSIRELIAVLLCTGTVLSAEMMNSALEKLCDYSQPYFDVQIKVIKDVAAGAVLFISIISAITGALIFLPKIWQLL